MTTSRVSEGSAMVFGASGFLGKWLVKELLEQGVRVTAAVRSANSGRLLNSWLDSHTANTAKLDLLHVDFTLDGLGLGTSFVAKDLEVYNVAGAYAFGMTPHEARRANVDSSRRVVEFSDALGATRLVHVSGYRVGGQDPTTVPWTDEKRTHTYGALGAYEASKAESDGVVQASANRLGVPLTIVNPATVIGHSLTGESEQTLGLATTILDLLGGRLRAVPGGRSIFVPVVTVDYLVRFMTLLPRFDETRGHSYWVLDDDTPNLPDLLHLVGTHHGVRAPCLHLPVSLIKRLPQTLTHADPETLSFLSADRYPIGPALKFAESHGLHHPDVAVSLQRWSDHLAVSPR